MPRDVKLRRRHIAPAVKAAVIERDGMVCRYCGGEVVPKVAGEQHRPDHLHFDHVTPWAMGGADDVDNLVVSCAACNLARVRPARGSAAANRLLWKRVGDEYHWADSRYRPPSVVSRHDPDVLFTLEEAGEILGRDPVSVLVLVVDKVLLATTGVTHPIRVAFPGCFASFVDERTAELGWEEVS